MSAYVHRWFQQNFPLMRTAERDQVRGWRGMRWTRRGMREVGVAVHQFQSATVVQVWLYLVVTAQVVLAHTDPLYRHGDAEQGQLVCKTRQTLDRKDSYFQNLISVAFSCQNVNTFKSLKDRFKMCNFPSVRTEYVAKLYLQFFYF